MTGRPSRNQPQKVRKMKPMQQLIRKSFLVAAALAVAVAALGVAKSFHAGPVAQSCSLETSGALDKSGSLAKGGDFDKSDGL